MIVFSNTTPIIALSSIRSLHLLPDLFGEIHLVHEVIDECSVGEPIAVPDLLVQLSFPNNGIGESAMRSSWQS